MVDTTELRPTANREALYDDGLLADVRESLGDQLRGWITRIGTRDAARLAAFLRIYHLGVKALAVYDDEMLRLVQHWWPFETNVGPLTLAEFADRYGLVRYSPVLDDFRQLAPVAAAQGVPVVNAGYVYDADLLARLPDIDQSLIVEVMTAADLTTRLDPLDASTEAALRPFLAIAQRALDRMGVEVLVRSFEPLALPALYLLDADAGFLTATALVAVLALGATLEARSTSSPIAGKLLADPSTRDIEVSGTDAAP